MPFFAEAVGPRIEALTREEDMAEARQECDDAITRVITGDHVRLLPRMFEQLKQVDANYVLANGDAVLHMAWSPEMARVLLDAGANPDAVNKAGLTPLMVRASTPGSARPTPSDEVARELLNGGANALRRGPAGRTALHMAVLAPNPAVAGYLNSYETRRAVDDGFQTPLDVAREVAQGPGERGRIGAQLVKLLDVDGDGR
jgi:ankyrin repeat protein